MNELLQLPRTSNRGLIGPYELTLEQFYNLPVSVEEVQARKAIYMLQQFIEAADVPGKIDKDSIAPVHNFTEGIYTRELTMPPGFIIVGKRHAREHLVIMTKGRCTVFTERGWEDFEGYNQFKSPAGEKRVLFVHEETTWVTIHKTNADDLESAEKDLILAETPALGLNSLKRLKGYDK
jgi:hypothetical protein